MKTLTIRQWKNDLTDALATCYYLNDNLMGATLWTGKLADADIFETRDKTIQKFVRENNLVRDAFSIKVPNHLTNNNL